MRSVRFPQRRGSRAALRILAAVSLPGFVATHLAWGVITTNVRHERESEQVIAGVHHVARLVDLRLSLYQERIGIETTIRGETLGIDGETTAKLLGITGTILDRDNRGTTFDALAAVGVEQQPFTADELAAAHASVAASTTSTSSNLSAFTELDNRVAAAITSSSAELTDRAARIGDAALVNDLVALNRSIDAFRDRSSMVSRLSEMWFAPDDDSARRAGRELAASTDRFARNGLDLASSSISPPAFVEAWGPFLENARTGRFQTAVEGVLAAPTAASRSFELGPVIEVFGAGLHEMIEIIGVVDTATASLVERAAATRAEARHEAFTASVIAGATLFVAFVASMLVVSSILRPLRRLTAQATAIGRGQLAAQIRVRRGPRELKVASAAFDDVTANLRLLEHKTRALADGRLDDESIERSLPGELGAALSRSMGVLAVSVRERAELQTRLHYQAYHDSLTGLPNRLSAVATIEQHLARTRQDATPTTVLFLDLDDFKRANDTFGHATGDRVLCAVAERVRSILRNEQTFARLGGDEFVIVAGGLDDAAVDALATRVVTAIDEPFELGGVTVHLGTCIGIAVETTGTSTAHELLAHADLAVYRAKDRGRNSIHRYDERLQAEVDTRVRVEAQLRRALETGQALTLHYQPIVDAATEHPLGLEALVRLEGEHGTIRPDEFIPIAELSNLIMDLDRWVLDRALTDLATWHAADHHVTVSINMSGRHVVHASFVETVRDALGRSGVDPRYVVLEITETVLLEDLTRAAGHLEKVRDLGVRIAIDDFGTGYTSIAHLRNLPVDQIKIDRSFIAGFPNPDALGIVRMVTELATHLGVPTVAEGVETADQANLLRELGCDKLQGYHYARPSPVDQATRVLTALSSALGADPRPTA